MPSPNSSSSVNYRSARISKLARASTSDKHLVDVEHDLDIAQKLTMLAIATTVLLEEVAFDFAEMPTEVAPSLLQHCEGG